MASRMIERRLLEKKREKRQWRRVGIIRYSSEEIETPPRSIPSNDTFQVLYARNTFLYQLLSKRPTSSFNPTAVTSYETRSIIRAHPYASRVSLPQEPFHQSSALCSLRTRTVSLK